ncbi:hypothetical protein NMG60_11025379 [Bertholletia excelsa]
MKSSKPIFRLPILQVLQQCKTLDGLKQVHAQMITTGLILHTYPISRLLLVSSALASLSYTITIFNQVHNRTIFLYNTLISSLTTHRDQTHTALSLYTRILSHQPTLKPNEYTYPSLFKACVSHSWIDYGRALHAHVLKFLNSPYDNFVQASLINFYSQCGKWGICRYLFDRISEPDLATWNSLLSAYARNAGLNCVNGVCSGVSSLSMEVLFLFVDMQRSLVRPNEVTMVALLSACADVAALSQGTWAHTYIQKNNLELNRFVGANLIDMYAKCGCLSLANQVFDKMPHRDTFCYNAMIRGLAVHGHGHHALDLFKKMRLEGLLPDDVTILAAICACSHVGLVDMGCEIFDSMEEDYGIKPRVQHYGCLIDLLGRAGRFKEAEERVDTMPMKPNAVLWRSLLGAARVHGNLELGKVALRNLIELEPETSGNYVLLSNMYALIDRWDDVKGVRKLMKQHGVDKMPGTSLVEIDGAMHEFLTGDKMHPWTKEIYLKLEEISRRLQEYGHKPRIKEVLFDIEEEEKEDALSYHSEKLAIAFALIASEHKMPIRIIKNLRVCGDCHESTKLISRIYEREIVVRDNTRFHHFKDGTCSCLDYW